MNLEDLIAQRDIERQLIKFARAMDNKDWESIKTILSDDVIADFGTGEIQGVDNIINVIRSFLDNCGPTQHLLGNIIIDVSGNKATSEAYVSDMHLSRDSKSELTFRTLGNYRDKWELINSEWLLVHRIKDNRATIGSMDIFK